MRPITVHCSPQLAAAVTALHTMLNLFPLPRVSRPALQQSKRSLHARPTLAQVYANNYAAYECFSLAIFTSLLDTLVRPRDLPTVRALATDHPVLSRPRDKSWNLALLYWNPSFTRGSLRATAQAQHRHSTVTAQSQHSPLLDGAVIRGRRADPRCRLRAPRNA